MANLECWKPKLEWKKEGNTFAVVVSKHKSYTDENIWCTYLYIYPKHPAFKMFNRDGGMFEQPHFNCHSYVSYFKAHLSTKTNEVCSYQLGWDYNHDGDSYYTSIESVDAAGTIFYNAEALFNEALAWEKENSYEGE